VLRQERGRGEASISGMLYFLLLLRFSFVPVFSNLALTMMLGSISKFLGFGSWRVQSKSSKTVKIKNSDQDVQTTSSWHLRCVRLLNTQTSSRVFVFAVIHFSGEETFARTVLCC